ncbi:MAG: cyclic lactone autoinducer peptide [Deltaproteobacteria bacterium]
MSAINNLVRDNYLRILSAIGITATWFAMMSSGTCTGWFIYQEEIPQSIIKHD